MRISDWSSDVCSSDLQDARERSTHAEQRGQLDVAQVAALHVARLAPLRIGAGRGALAHGVEVDHLRQAQAARDGVGQVLCVPLPGEGEICGGRHGYSPLMRTCSALPNWSVPETTMRSPSSRPDTISTLLKLLAPRSEEHTSELQSIMPITYVSFCLKKT